MSDQTPIQTNTAAPSGEASHRHRLMAGPRHLPWRHTIIQRLEKLLRLEPGWDGYRGQPVSLEIAVFALRLLEATCRAETPAPQIVPSGDGEVQIEWHEQKVNIELYIRAANDVEAWRSLVGGDRSGEELKLTDDFSVVAAWLEHLTERSIASGTAAA